MTPSKIRFNCPSCGIQLDVPAALAGVTGPCPSCQSTITAPIPQPAAPEPAAPEPVAPAAHPRQQPAPEPPAPPEQPSQPSYAPPVEPTQPPQSPAPRSSTDSPPAGQNVFPTVVPDPVRPEVHPLPDEPPFPLEPEPIRELPTHRSDDGMASHSPAPTAEAPRQPSSEPQRSNAGGKVKQGSRIPSILFLLAALVIMTIGVVAILNQTGVVGLNTLKSLLGGGSQEAPATELATPSALDTPRPAPPAPSSEEPVNTTIPKPTEPPLDGGEEEEAPVLPPAELPPGEDFREGETPLPVGIGAVDDPDEIQKILEKFLAARNLTERTPFLSVQSQKNPNVASSPLAQALPDPSSTHFWEILKDPQEKRTDFFYIASWDGTRNTPPEPIAIELHKWEGSESTQVHSEAFVEFYTQKLARYAASPLDRPARFFVLAECVARCFETEAVREHTSKATLKMGSFPNDRTAVKAYFDKKGEILDELKKYREGVAFREDIPMTVTLAWSKESEGPRYLELIQINSFDWHP
ncbi:hypothetical protein [Roseibacillus persicicus]|nr:hypothetical protein [Roseibacillus persicicus]